MAFGVWPPAPRVVSVDCSVCGGTVGDRPGRVGLRHGCAWPATECGCPRGRSEVVAYSCTPTLVPAGTSGAVCSRPHSSQRPSRAAFTQGRIGFSNRRPQRQPRLPHHLASRRRPPVARMEADHARPRRRHYATASMQENAGTVIWALVHRCMGFNLAPCDLSDRGRSPALLRSPCNFGGPSSRLRTILASPRPQRPTPTNANCHHCLE